MKNIFLIISLFSTLSVYSQVKHSRLNVSNLKYLLRAEISDTTDILFDISESKLDTLNRNGIILIEQEDGSIKFSYSVCDTSIYGNLLLAPFFSREIHVTFDPETYEETVCYTDYYELYPTKEWVVIIGKDERKRDFSKTLFCNNQ